MIKTLSTKKSEIQDGHVVHMVKSSNATAIAAQTAANIASVPGTY